MLYNVIRKIDYLYMSVALVPLPYTKIEFVEQDLGVSRITAANHLDTLVANGFVEKKKIGRTNFYINRPLFSLLTQISLDNE